MLNALKFHFPLQLKRWERKKCKPNSLPVLHKMHVRIGDTVQVIAGREKGKVGEVTRLFKHNSTVIVKDLNLKSKHKKGTDDEPGEIVMVSKISIQLVFGPLMMLCIY
jgi:large subunit ribosomal protein L24